MAAGDKVNFIVRTSPGFLDKFRAMDSEYDSLMARKEACIRGGDPKGAEEAARLVSKLGCDIQDLIYDELERHWGPKLLEDSRLPNVPDDWRTFVRGRFLQIEYEEREIFEDR
ncbi:MAG: hypothetical protein KF696_14630 [Planctomycetes bacterium]|nr:hypothetical protein [Planctomycetota bacterium]MCW8137146.1 hypothetical protein [Planctomycetota bacterium]